MTDILRKHAAVILCCVGLIMCTALYLACSRGLTETLEAESAEIAREFLEGAPLLINHLNGQEDFDKPPLFYWTIALFAGISPSWELAARLPSMLSAALVIFLFCRLALFLNSRMLFAVSCLVFITSPKVFWMCQIARMDMSFTAACFAAVCAFHQFFEREKKKGEDKRARPGIPWTFFIAASTAVMLKGPVGAILTFTPVMLFLAMEGERRLLKHVFLGRGMLLFLFLAAPWFAAASIETDLRFFHRFILEENLSRFTSLIPGGTYKEFNYSPLYTYPVYFLTGLLPWSLAAPFWLFDTVKNWEERDDISRLFFIYIVFVFVFFSLALSKRSDYILPVYPAVSFLTARYLLSGNELTRIRFISLFMFTIAATLGAALSAGAICLGYPDCAQALSIFSRAGRSEAALYFLRKAPLFLPGFLLLFFTGLSGLYFCLKDRKRPDRILSSYALHVSIIFLLAGAVFIPAIYRQKDVRKFCINISRIVNDKPLFYYGFWDEECTFYLKRRIVRLSRREFEKLMNKDERIFLILRKREFEKLKSEQPPLAFVYKKDSPLLRPLLLVSNQPQ